MCRRELLWPRRTQTKFPSNSIRGYAIVVRGSIGNVKNLNFLLDTGAVPSVLDQRIALKLHLTGSVERLSVFTKNLDTERVIAPDVQLGPQHVKALPVVVRDLSFAEKALGTRVDAMIGLDFLGQGPFTIDYQFKRIAFGPIDPSLVAIPYQAGPGTCRRNEDSAAEALSSRGHGSQ